MRAHPWCGVRHEVRVLCYHSEDVAPGAEEGHLGVSLERRDDELDPDAAQLLRDGAERTAGDGCEGTTCEMKMGGRGRGETGGRSLPPFRTWATRAAILGVTSTALRGERRRE